MADMVTSPTQSTTESDVPAAMREVYRRLQRWRSERKGRRARIPEALWTAAGDLAREHGVNQVSRALHLEFKQLKRVTEVGTQNDVTQAKPSFVELIAPHTSAGRECILEVEGSRGKLRIELKGVATAEVAIISRALWEMLA